MFFSAWIHQYLSSMSVHPAQVSSVSTSSVTETKILTGPCFCFVNFPNPQGYAANRCNQWLVLPKDWSYMTSEVSTIADTCPDLSTTSQPAQKKDQLMSTLAAVEEGQQCVEDSTQKDNVLIGLPYNHYRFYETLGKIDMMWIARFYQRTLFPYFTLITVMVAIDPSGGGSRFISLLIVLLFIFTTFIVMEFRLRETLYYNLLDYAMIIDFYNVNWLKSKRFWFATISAGVLVLLFVEKASETQLATIIGSSGAFVILVRESLQMEENLVSHNKFREVRCLADDSQYHVITESVIQAVIRSVSDEAKPLGLLKNEHMLNIVPLFMFLANLPPSHSVLQVPFLSHMHDPDNKGISESWMSDLKYFFKIFYANRLQNMVVAFPALCCAMNASATFGWFHVEVHYDGNKQRLVGKLSRASIRKRTCPYLVCYFDSFLHVFNGLPSAIAEGNFKMADYVVEFTEERFRLVGQNKFTGESITFIPAVDTRGTLHGRMSSDRWKDALSAWQATPCSAPPLQNV
jgi:hypothetical protein